MAGLHRPAGTSRGYERGMASDRERKVEKAMRHRPVAPPLPLQLAVVLLVKQWTRAQPAPAPGMSIHSLPGRTSWTLAKSRPGFRGVISAGEDDGWDTEAGGRGGCDRIIDGRDLRHRNTGTSGRVIAGRRPSNLSRSRHLSAIQYKPHTLTARQKLHVAAVRRIPANCLPSLQRLLLSSYHTPQLS